MHNISYTHYSGVVSDTVVYKLPLNHSSLWLTHNYNARKLSNTCTTSRKRCITNHKDILFPASYHLFAATVTHHHCNRLACHCSLYLQSSSPCSQCKHQPAPSPIQHMLLQLAGLLFLSVLSLLCELHIYLIFKYCYTNINLIFKFCYTKNFNITEKTHCQH